MHDLAFTALETAAHAIQSLSGITYCTVESDNDSGEIIFIIDGHEYMLRLQHTYAPANG